MASEQQKLNKIDNEIKNRTTNLRNLRVGYSALEGKRRALYSELPRLNSLQQEFPSSIGVQIELDKINNSIKSIEDEANVTGGLIATIERELVGLRQEYHLQLAKINNLN